MKLIRNIFRRQLSSRRISLLLLVTLFVPLTVYLIGYNMIAVNTMNNRLVDISRNMLTFYQTAVESDLRKIELNLAEIVANDGDYRKLLNKISELEAHQSSYYIIEKSEAVLSMFPQIMGIYLYSPANDVFRSAYQDGYSYSEKSVVEESLLRLLEQRSETGETDAERAPSQGQRTGSQ